MPLTPNVIERLFFLTLNQGPAPMLDLWGGPAFHCVRAALKLGFFEALAGGPLTPEALAAKLQIDPRGTGILLGTLEALGYVEPRGPAYQDSPMTRRWLLDSGELNLKPFYLYWGALLEHFLPHLEDSIRSGQPPVHLYEWIETQPEVSRDFQEGMIALAQYVAKEVVQGVEVPQGATRLLDVGGGHGAYSLALCQAHPALNATIFDSPQALVTGRRAVQQASMEPQVTLMAGDFMRDELPGGFDLALVFNVLHGFLAPDNCELFRKIRQALNPGGQIVILEQIHGVSPLPLTSTAASLLSTAYFHLLGGQVHTYQEIQAWLEETGFSQVRRKNILKASSALIQASS